MELKITLKLISKSGKVFSVTHDFEKLSWKIKGVGTVNEKIINSYFGNISCIFNGQFLIDNINIIFCSTIFLFNHIINLKQTSNEYEKSLF